jgi:integrase
MSSEYSSEFASYISALVATKRSSGYKYETAEYHLHKFDSYCCLHDSSKIFSKNLILGWAKVRDGEDPAAHRTRISPIRELGKYMQSHGVSDAYILPSSMHRKIDRYVPHFFTKLEITTFFSACDNLKAHAGMYARHLVLPIFFRLLYCCGLRICEARTLRVENVDLKNGIIDIIESKGHRSRRIPFAQDLLVLFKIYDERVAKIYPGRIYFFPTTKSGCYKGKSISPIFKKIWKAAGLTQGGGNRPRAYDFRHHFALTNLNRWITSGVDVNSKLPYLTKYMGHSCMESTAYYLHLVPEFFPTFSKKVKVTESVLPEVDYDKK